jgi:hypothetical protein
MKAWGKKSYSEINLKNPGEGGPIPPPLASHDPSFFLTFGAKIVTRKFCGCGSKTGVPVG